MQEIVYLTHTNGDFKTADEIPLFKRSPFMEARDPFKGTTLVDILKTDPPHVLKTHLPAGVFDETL